MERDIAFKPDNMRTRYMLNHQRQHLAEHHIYGSSRLGIQKYLPDQAQYHFKSLGAGGTTNTLSTTRPWYTLYGNDLFKPTVYSNDLDTLNMGTQGMGINSHLLGLRQYELTNHLGNVQATVLDRATPILNNDTLVTGYKADISLAHDYYPFGMLMPGRYVSDTGQKCVTINTTVLVPVVVKVYLDGVLATGYKYGDPNTPAVHNLPVAMLAADEQPYVYHYNDASTHPNGEVVSAQLVEGHSEFGISLSEEPSGGVTAYFMIHADTNQTEQEIGFDLTLPDDCYMRMRVRQYAGTGEEYDEAVSWTNVDMSGAQQLMVPMDKAAIAAGGKTVLELEFNSAMGGNFPANQNNPDVFARNFYYKITHYEPKTRIAIVCDEKDSYRFGFWGGEKDNEIKEIGNSVDLGERMMDTRTGRLGMSVDPLAKQFPWQSPYVAAGNSPILYLDKNGEFQLDAVTADKYKHVAAYINTQMADDIMKNQMALKIFKVINPEATDDNIRNIYSAGTGPILMSSNYPNSQNAGGYTDYQKDRPSTIEINTKVFEYVNGVLGNSKATEREKQIAVMYLNVIIGHEVSGHEVGGYRGVDAKGNDIKVDEMNNESGWPDPGYYWEWKVFGIEPGMTEEKRSRPDGPIEGVESGNIKFKEGVVEDAYETIESKGTAPSTPTR